MSHHVTSVKTWEHMATAAAKTVAQHVASVKTWEHMATATAKTEVQHVASVKTWEHMATATAQDCGKTCDIYQDVGTHDKRLLPGQEGK